MNEILVSGGRVLRGEIEASGSKNSALPILAATVMIDEKIVIRNVPELKDVFTMISILKQIGRRVTFIDNIVTIEPGEIVIGNVPYELVSKMRASFNLLGPLTMSSGWARVGKPGGCNIGQRPVDFHINGLLELGLQINEEHGDIYARRPSDFSEEICHTFPIPSVGATEQIMTTAALVEGSKIVLNNVAKEPEIEDLQNFLNACGAKIKGAGTSRIEITGVSRLNGVDYTIIPDRIEIGTYLLAGVATRGDISIKGARADHLEALIDILKKMGTIVQYSENHIRVVARNPLKPVEVRSEPFPGFPTDLQPLITVVLATIDGISTVEESVFENRFNYVDELNRMGAGVKVWNRQATIQGGGVLSGAEINATDLRAAAALVIAGLVAEGKTTVKNSSHIFRGYEKLEKKLGALGANIKISSER